MQKKGLSIFYSRDARINSILVISAIVLFFSMVFYAEAISIKLFAPGNFTFNTTATRNINFTFNVTWETGWENQSNCTLFVKRNGTSAYTSWQAVANASNGTTPDANITNSTLSYMNYTFTTDGNYTWSIGCMNSSSVNPGVNYFPRNTTNFSFVLDTQVPSFTNTLSNSTSDSLVATGEKVVVGVNATDSSGIISGAVLYVNISGAARNVVNSTITVVGEREYMINFSFVIPSNTVGKLLNFTIEVNDSVGNVNQTSMNFTVAQDGTAPGPINLSNPSDMFNQSGTTVSFNFSATDNNRSILTCVLNISNGSAGAGEGVKISNIEASNGVAQQNSTTVEVSGIYSWNVTCTDGVVTNTSVSRTFRIDNLKPGFIFNTLSNLSNDPEVAPFEVVRIGVNVTDSITGINTVRLLANISGAKDNEVSTLTTVSNNASANFSYRIPINLTHGTVLNFTIQVNDSVGNFNNSAMILINISDNVPPNLTINVPSTTQAESSFIVNATVSADAVNCSFAINASHGETAMTLSSGECISSMITNLTNGSMHNVTVRSYDTNGNLNLTITTFTISDLTPPSAATIAISDVDVNSAVVTVTANESVNMSLTSTGSTSFSSTSLATHSKTRQITISELSDATAYNLTVTICDKAGNCVTNTTLGFETDEEPASASSGGGGGAALTSTSNVAYTTGKTWDKVAADSEATFSISNSNIALTAVEINPNKELSSAGVTIESLKAKPSTISASASSKVYQYIEIKKSNFVDSDLSDAKVRFKVTKQWLLDNSVNENAVVLYRYSGGLWNKLSTIKTGGAADPTYWYYEATTPGFSTFAIGYDETAPIAGPSETVAETTTIPCGNGVCESGEDSSSCPTDCPAATQASETTEPSQPEQKRTAMAWLIVGLLIVISAFGYYKWQTKKHKHHYGGILK